MRTKLTRVIAVCGAFAVAGAGFALVTGSGHAAPADNMCETEEWEGADTAGEDLAYKVGIPEGDNGTTVDCFVHDRTVSGTEDEPMFLSAGYGLQQAKEGEADDKSLVFAQIMCFNADDELVFKQSTARNLYASLSEPTMFYPRAVFTPEETGDFSCGIRMVNYLMGQQPREVYAINGYLNVRDDLEVGAIDGSTLEPPTWENGEMNRHLAYGSNTILRQTKVSVPDGVGELGSAAVVNFSKCSWGDKESDPVNKCPEGSWTDGGPSEPTLSIKAWQTEEGNDRPCLDPAVESQEMSVTGDQHHAGLKLDAQYAMVDSPECSRDVIVRAVINVPDDRDLSAGYSAAHNTILSVYG